MENKNVVAPAARGLALLRASWAAGFDVAFCAVCFHYGHCQFFNHHDIKFDPACDAFALAAPVVPLV
jgi:hypothetical protein